MKSGVYAIRNVETGECYVGSSVDMRSRWRYHRKTLRRHCSKHPPLQLAWDKYGEDAFEFVILEKVGLDSLIEREQHWMVKLNSLVAGYNSAPNAGRTLGIVRSAKTRARMSKPKSDEHRLNMRQPKSAEHRAKLSEALRRRWARGEKFVSPTLGRQLSAETKAKISAAKRKPPANDLPV